MSKVPAHFELIPDIIELRNQYSPETKLLINGDIKDRKQALALFERFPNLDGFMIGRGVFENPYCFTDHAPTKAELLDLLHLHLSLYNNSNFEPLKHYFKIYIRDFPGASDLRAQLMTCHSTDEALSFLQRFEQHPENFGGKLEP